MNRFDIINRIGDKYRIGNTETGEFSYAQALKTVGKDIRDYQKATRGTQHKFLDLRFENERLVILVECKNKFSRWDKSKIQGQLQDYVRFEKAYSDKKIVAILAETDGDDVWVWYGQSVIIDDDHKIEEETALRTFEEYENLCFGKVNDKIKIVDSIKTLNEKLHSDGINEKLRSQFVGTCLLALKNGLLYKDVKETIDPKTGRKVSPEKVVIKSIKDILEGLLTRGGSLNKAGKLAVLNSKILDDQDIRSLTYKELEEILKLIDDNVVPYINDKSTAGQDLLNLFFTTFNKWVLGSDFAQIIDERKIDTENIADYIMRAFDGFVDLVEIKKPNGMPFWAPTKDHDNYVPSTDLVKAITQCLNYIHAIEQEANSVKFITKTKSKVIKPRCILIFGRSNDWNDEQREAYRILNAAYNQISILTYDHLLLRAKNVLGLNEESTNDDEIEDLPF